MSTATRDQEIVDGEAAESDAVPSDAESVTKDEAVSRDSDEAEGKTDDADHESHEEEPKVPATGTSIEWKRVVAFGVLPALALLLALVAGYFKWIAVSGNQVGLARTESVRVASEDAVAMLSYNPETADKQLGAARERLTGDFKDAYTALTRQVVIPGAKEKHISAVAKVNAASSVSATANHAVVLLFVDQTVTIGEGGTPTDTQPVIRVTLEKVDGRWLVSHFDPV